MKKIIMLTIIAFLIPINILAYSDKIIPGGQTIGININSKGLIVVGYYKINGIYASKKDFSIGDVILKVNNIEVNSINEMLSALENITDSNILFEIDRDNKIINKKIKLILEDNKYKTGIYVKESIGGIGTLTYIDPITKIYGALGHEIAFKDTKRKVDVRNGNIFQSSVRNIDRSSNGYVGSKNATINYNNILGTINSNTLVGIYGKYSAPLSNNNLLEVATFNEIEKGDAYIYTVLNDENIKKYNIQITNKYINAINTTKSISFIINDEELLKDAGGIVQGMSGSPIIQNNKIIGAVTNVVIEDVKKGYAVFIETMLKEGER
ncbi:MAG: SpoIVB peptidase S55 domain-containing protein [Bacilli bacterium]